MAERQNGTNQEKHVMLKIEEETPGAGNFKMKFTRMLSITENYQRKFLSDDLIYTDELMRSVSKNEIAKCESLLNESRYDLSVVASVYFFPPLLLAAKKRRYEILKLMLDKGADINIQDKKNATALHYAIQQRSLQCIDLLLDRGIRTNVQDKLGNIPLHIAAAEGILEVVEKLLDSDSDPNKRNKKNQTPLHFACMNGNEKILTLLLEKGGRWDLKDINFWWPLHFAAFHGHHICCDILIKNSGDNLQNLIRARNKDQATPLILAAKKGHSWCCQVLKESEINAFDAKKNTALHLATSIGFLKTVEVLLDMKADVNVRNKSGNTPIHKSAMQKNLDCLKKLVEHPDAIPSLNNDKQSVIHLASMTNCDESLKYLLDNKNFKDQISAQDKEGKTALHLALNQRHYEGSQVLVEAGIDTNLVDNKGNIALHVAAGGGMYHSCKYLLSGTRVHKINERNNEGTTPLHLAAMNGSVDCCKFLLVKGADLTAIDSNGFSPLHVAANEGNLDVIKWLTKKGGGYINQAVEVSGDTPLHLAARNGHYNCCDFILKNIKKDFIIRLNNKDNSALDEAFSAEKDEIFSLILSKTPLTNVQEKHNIEKYQCFQSSLHEYMHEALDSDREIVQRSIIESKWWFSGFSSEFCGDGQCPNLTELTKRNSSLADMVYDNCIQKGCDSTRYDFRILEDSYYCILEGSITTPGGSNPLKRESPFDPMSGQLRPNAVQHPRQPQHPLLAAVATERMPLMQHKLTKAYLDYKWKGYMRIFLWLRVLLEVLLVATLGFYLKTVSNYEMVKDVVSRETLCSNETLDPEIDAQVVGTSWALNVFLFVALIFILGLEVAAEICYKSVKSVFSFTYTVRVLCLVGVGVVLIPFNLCVYDIVVKEDWQWQVGILTLLLSWFYLILTLNEIPFLSVFMPITRAFLKSFARVLFYIILIIFIFAYSFHLLLHPMPAFQSIPVSFIKTTVWLLGDLGYDDTFLESPVSYPIMTNIIFLLLVTSISGFIINMVIAQPSDYLDKFREKAALHKLASRIRLFLKLDMSFMSLSEDLAKKYKVGYYVLKHKGPLNMNTKGTGDAASNKSDSTDAKREDVTLAAVLQQMEQIEGQVETLKKLLVQAEKKLK